MSAIQELESVVDELGIKGTIRALAVIISDCMDEENDEERAEHLGDVAEELDNIDAEGLD